MSMIITEIENLAKEFSMDQYGITELTRPLTIDFYQNWLKSGQNGSMKYLEDHLEAKTNPQSFWPMATSAVVFAKTYSPHPHPPVEQPVSPLRTALYAQGADYHHWFKQELTDIAMRLSAVWPESSFVALTDSAPVLERDLAYRARLGWFGKNTCLIHPKKGSLFFIGEIYTSLPMQKTTFEPLPDFCGTCTRCIDICPTDALESPRVLNAGKCISYLTIESKQVAPVELRKKIGDWFFGCDLCQTVCPWNERAFREKSVTLSTVKQQHLSPAERQNLVTELREILTLSGKRLQRQFHHSPLSRAGPFGLRRNALVVVANQNLTELRSEVAHFQQDSRLGELSQWCLQQLEVPNQLS
jgi:epoxyqueuosine reductase